MRQLPLATPRPGRGFRMRTCPSCEQAPLACFHRALDVPTNSCILLGTQAEALAYPLGQIDLGLCHRCGFVGNMAFRPELTEYSGRYEETQGFSPTFSAFLRDQAQRLIDRFGLHGRKVLEIGCGKGEFLTLVCQLGDNQGLGYDPGYRADRGTIPPGVDVRIVTELFTEHSAVVDADLICCRMTLEHIQPTLRFMRSLRKAIGNGQQPAVFFQVPDATRIIESCAFEDIYYEHCSYFAPYSLARLFSAAGFDVVEIERTYGEQYLTIEAYPAAAEQGSGLRPEEERAALVASVQRFPASWEDKVSAWRARLNELAASRKRAALWGSGSKGVAFLSAVGTFAAVGCAVDINPYRQGTYMPGSGLAIVPPTFLLEYRPDVVIVMNPIYREEIAANLRALGLVPELVTL